MVPLRPLSPSARSLIGRASTFVTAGSLGLVACGSPVGPPAGGLEPLSAASDVAVMALPSPSLVAESSQPALREAIGIGVMSGELVVETPNALLVLDASSGIVTEEIPLPELPQINGMLLTADSLWVLDHDNGKVVRVDRGSADVVAEIDIGGRAVSLLATPEGIWAGSAHVVPESVSLIDVETNDITRRIELGAFPIYADDHLWFGRDQTGWDSTVRKVDPRTGEVVGSIDLDGAEGCYLGGRFPDAVWSWCFDPPPDDTDVTRLDVEGLGVSATQPLGAAGSLVGVHEEHSWFSAEPADGSLRLVKMNNASNVVETVYSRGSVVPITMHDGALWFLDPEGGTLGRLRLTDL